VPGSFDAIIVGTGFGGAILACRLAEAGKRVLALERGRRWGPADFPRDITDIDRQLGALRQLHDRQYPRPGGQPQDRQGACPDDLAIDPGVRRRTHRMTSRRAFVSGLGVAIARPLAARVQQQAMPVIGYLSSTRRAFPNGCFLAYQTACWRSAEWP
jgi:NAD(P)-binding Rossmann-like domain